MNACKNEIIINDKNIIVEYKDKSLSELKLTLRNLIFELSDLNIEFVALNMNDELLKELGLQNFKDIYNDCHKIIEKDRYLNILLYEPPKEIKCKNEMLRLINHYHSTLYGGHCGINKCIKKLKQKYVWKNMNKMVKNYINNCQNAPNQK